MFHAKAAFDGISDEAADLIVDFCSCNDNWRKTCDSETDFGRCIKYRSILSRPLCDVRCNTYTLFVL